MVYCNAVVAGTADIVIKRLQSIQNIAARYQVQDSGTISLSYAASTGWKLIFYAVVNTWRFCDSEAVPYTDIMTY